MQACPQDFLGEELRKSAILYTSAYSTEQDNQRIDSITIHHYYRLCKIASSSRGTFVAAQVHRVSRAERWHERREVCYALDPGPPAEETNAPPIGSPPKVVDEPSASFLGDRCGL